MVAKRQSAASGNAVASAPKTRKTRTSAAAVGEQPVAKGVGWARTAPAEPEAGVGLDGNTAAGDVGGGKDTGAAPPEPKSRRKGKAAETPPGSESIVTNVSRDLIQGVERIERLNEEIEALGDDKKEFFAELKTKGYKTKIIRKLIAERAADPDVVKEDRDLMELYRDALAAGVGVGDEEDD